MFFAFLLILLKNNIKISKIARAYGQNVISEIYLTESPLMIYDIFYKYNKY